MKIELEIPDDDLKDILIDRLADRILSEYMEPAHLSYTDREAHQKKKVNEILNKIDWKKAAPTLSEMIIRKFFEKGMM